VNQKHGIVSDANLVDCIKQARVESTHEVLEIGFGWGALAIQLVRRTGCRYIGITLSKEQLTFAQAMVKEACLEVLVLLFHTFFSFFTKTTHLNLSYCLWSGAQQHCTFIGHPHSSWAGGVVKLQDKITFQLCDYRSVPGYHQYNRIISWWAVLSGFLVHGLLWLD